MTWHSPMAAQYPHWLSLSSQVLSCFFFRKKSEGSENPKKIVGGWFTGCLMWEKKTSGTRIGDSLKHDIFVSYVLSLFDVSILQLKTFFQEKRKQKQNKNNCWTSGPCQNKNHVFEKKYNRKLRTNKTFEKNNHFISRKHPLNPPACLRQVTLGISPPPQPWRNSALHTAVPTTGQRIKKRAPLHGAKWVLTR